MKPFIKEFMLRGLLVSGSGPLVLAIIYGVLGATGQVSSLTPREVCLGIVSITLLAFVAAGMTAIYQQERLPLPTAILIHGAALYAAYILVYLLNGWLQQQWQAILVFTGIFVAGYAVIWLIIYLVTKAKTRKINALLHSEK